MEFTGERYLPEIEGRIGLEHIHRYKIVTKLVHNKICLDIACGEGYGVGILSHTATRVCGVDISEETVNYAVNKYKLKNVEFKTGSTSEIPYPDNFFDVVTSFETIEHHDEHEKMMEEIKRVLRQDGIFIISSPEKTNYNAFLQSPNKFHVKELEYSEFKSLISKYFKFYKFHFQTSVYGSLVVSENPDAFSFVNSEKDFREVLKPRFDVCIASDKEFNFDLSSINIGVDTVKVKKIENLEKQLEDIQKSLTWKIGRFALSPFGFLKPLLKK